MREGVKDVSGLAIVIVILSAGGLLCAAYLLGARDGDARGYVRGLEERGKKEREWWAQAARDVDRERQKILREGR